MQPRQSTPESLTERLPAPVEYGANTYAHDRIEPVLPTSIESIAPRIEQAGENNDAHADAALQAAGAITLPPPLPSVSNPASLPVQDDTPIIAADEDLIEKEWVDKAKKIILSTRDDPYRREQEIAKLQIDYIKKRYDRVIGEAPRE